MQIDAVVTAGGIPAPDEPLYPFTQGKSKAMLAVAGKPMVQWVLDALSGSPNVRRVAIVGLSGEEGLHYARTLGFVPNQGDMLHNIRAGAEWVLGQDRSATHVLIVSSDIPTITPQCVDWLVETALTTDHDLYYTLVPQETMEKRFPGSKRTYTRLKEMTVCGGDMNLAKAALIAGETDLWNQIIAARKSALKQASLVGLEPLLLLLTRRLTIERAERIVQKRLSIRGKALPSPYAELGMDVDKPRQLELVSADLASRAA
ncbi:MAG: nucleotidyltransferase family protein [Chloroflexi bacterium]|nr:nucleotidyltransferase family protein [Chloroflexota bacterium]